MKFFNLFNCAKSKLAGFRKLEYKSDDLILRVTRIDPKEMPKYWRNEARIVLKDLYRIDSDELNNASAAIIKLAFYCHGFETCGDFQSRQRLSSAIRKLRSSYEASAISSEASEFSYSFANA